MYLDSRSVYRITGSPIVNPIIMIIPYTQDFSPPALETLVPRTVLHFVQLFSVPSYTGPLLKMKHNVARREREGQV